MLAATWIIYGRHDTNIPILCYLQLIACACRVPHVLARETMSRPPAEYTCRFCRKRQEGKHMIALFSSTSLEKELPAMLSSIFEVPVDADDGFPMYGCRNCMSSASSVYEKLNRLRSMANTSYREATCTGTIDVHGLYIVRTMAICHHLIVTGRQLKRPKDTSSGPSVSPATIRAQPPCKRRSSAGKQLFPNSMYYIAYTYDHYVHNNNTFNFRQPTYSSPNTGTNNTVQSGNT